MHKKQKKKRRFGEIAAIAFGLALFLTILGMMCTAKSFHEATISREAEAVLASAGVEDGEIVSLPVIYYDQEADECVNVYDGDKNVLAGRQFEWQDCGYLNGGLEQGLVEQFLGEDGLPVATGVGKLLPNQGVTTENFERWFTEVEGESQRYVGALEMQYAEDGAEFYFYQENFYPLDKLIATDDNNQHNHLFTMNFAVPFMVIADGNEWFEIEADDDTFVYIGDELVLDLGGVHSAMVAGFMIMENGEVYTSVNGGDLAYSGVTVTAGESKILRIFHADRNSVSSVFNMSFNGMNLVLQESDSVRDTEMMEVAYDPTESGFVAPLGETLSVEPGRAEKYTILMTVESGLAAVFAVLLGVSLKHLVRKKYSRRIK